MKIQSDKIEIVAPNLKRRLSGVTATVVRLVPLMAGSIGVVATGPGLPENLPHISLLRAATLPGDRWRVWHARRNIEMLLGLVLRHIFRRKYRMLFTSASQRHHSRYTRWLISKMDQVIATSQKTAGYLERPPVVILHGIDTETFAPAQDRAGLRARLGLPEGQLVGCYGRIRHQKGTDVFVDAMIRVVATVPDAIGVIMGRATEQHLGFERDLKQKLAQAGLSDKILFCPEVTVDQMPGWYQALDLYVAPQRWEGFGLTPIESMACGVPVVATYVGAFEELILPGKTGRLVPPGEVGEMAQAVTQVLNSGPELRKMGQAARTDMLARFKLEREAAEIIEVYEGLLGAKPNGPESS